MIIFYISGGHQRPSDLLRLMPDVDRRVLMQQLQEMMTSGLIKKDVASARPLVVNYTLTEMGESLLPVIAIMEQWSEKYRHDLEKYVVLKVKSVKPMKNIQ